MKEHVHLGADLKGNVRSSRLSIIDSLGAGLNVTVDAMVVARGEGGQVTEAVEGDRVLGGGVAEGGGPARDITIGDVV